MSATEIDPVCGMSVSTHDARHTSSHAGKTWYFCCAGCRAKFDADPSRFEAKLAPAAHAPSIEASRSSAPRAARKWTCPMHPEIVRDGPGSCPICGMALEPRDVSLDDEE